MVRACKNGLKIAKLLDQLACRLWANSRYTGDIIDAVAHQGEDVPDFFRRDPEFLQYLRTPDSPVIHRIEHVDAGIFVDQLHQILVGADDRDFPACLARSGYVAGDDVVCLKARLLDAWYREGACCDAD